MNIAFSKWSSIMYLETEGVLYLGTASVSVSRCNLPSVPDIASINITDVAALMPPTSSFEA